MHSGNSPTSMPRTHGCLTVLGETRNGELIPWGKPWYRQPISGKLRRKFGVSPGFAAHFGHDPKTVKYPAPMSGTKSSMVRVMVSVHFYRATGTGFGISSGTPGPGCAGPCQTLPP